MKDGEWGREHSQASDTEGAFHSELFAMGEVLARQIKFGLQADKKVAPERFSALERIVNTAEKSRKGVAQTGQG